MDTGDRNCKVENCDSRFDFSIAVFFGCWSFNFSSLPIESKCCPQLKAISPGSFTLGPIIDFCRTAKENFLSVVLKHRYACTTVFRPASGLPLP